MDTRNNLTFEVQPGLEHTGKSVSCLRITRLFRLGWRSSISVLWTPDLFLNGSSVWHPKD